MIEIIFAIARITAYLKAAEIQATEIGDRMALKINQAGEGEVVLAKKFLELRPNIRVNIINDWLDDLEGFKVDAIEEWSEIENRPDNVVDIKDYR